ncbi:hypothetical protein [Actinoplanes sp. NBRC 101535]|uniref:hypothetical protein n=1 Tax=Actinoplanes sp. NBRC 101535 TaxID=3032196 RepID=UPI0024A59C6E|nr:hypothetical protein [Actinoplanes sp. NBRC 101535]GLY08144.1 hypothetical protein Acsp01_85230 [Actinoplanes sp. NBRC 101535]
MTTVGRQDVKDIGSGHDPDPARSMSLRSAAYTEDRWYDLDLRAVLARTWQWVCHVAAVRQLVSDQVDAGAEDDNMQPTSSASGMSRRR